MNAGQRPCGADGAQRLAEAGATTRALLYGQIDAVIDGRNGTPVLLAKAQATLRQSEARYRYIVETTNEGVWLIDAGASLASHIERASIGTENSRRP